MRSLFFNALILVSSFYSFGQSIGQTTYGLGMSIEANQTWLTSLKNVDNKEQLIMIQDRFFKPTRPIIKATDEDVPVMVVNGIPIHPEMDEGLRNFLATELIAEDIEIEVLDKEPEELLANKRWTGLILMNVTNKKTRKRMYKQN